MGNCRIRRHRLSANSALSLSTCQHSQVRKLFCLIRRAAPPRDMPFDPFPEREKLLCPRYARLRLTFQLLLLSVEPLLRLLWPAEVPETGNGFE